MVEVNYSPYRCCDEAVGYLNGLGKHCGVHCVAIDEALLDKGGLLISQTTYEVVHRFGVRQAHVGDTDGPFGGYESGETLFEVSKRLVRGLGGLTPLSACSMSLRVAVAPPSFA